MKYINKTNVIIILCIVVFVTNNVNARRAVIAPSKIAEISNPMEKRDSRILLFFDLPNGILNTKSIVDFALLKCEAEVNDAIAGHIEIFPITIQWRNRSDISWDDPWDRSGGDYSSEYLTNNFTLKSSWGKREISIDITEIVEDWQNGNLFNNGIIFKLSSDDLASYPIKYQLEENDIELIIFYSSGK